MSRESLRIIQITDTHISPAPERQALGVDSFQALANVLAVMQRDLWPPDLIIATGDLADDGSPAAYGRLCSLLTPLACPVYCVPGNHDDWPTMCTTLQDGPVQCGHVVVREPWQLVLLNSQVPGHSHGFLPSSELTALEEAIQSAPDRHTLVGLHHGPLTVCPMEPCQLLNAEEFLALLQRYPSVRGVVSGHNHCLVEASQGHLR